MPLSFVQYTADGATDTFNIPFGYLSTSHIQVKINGVPDTGITFPTASTVKTASVPTGGAIVEVRRVTPNDARLVDFSDGSLLGESDLDTSALQTFFISQEVTDDLSNRLGLNALNQYDAGNHVIKNLAPGVLDTDAANLGQLQPFAASAASSASAAAASATAAQNSATVSANAATEAQNAALLAEDWANKTTGTVNGSEYSAKKYAQDAANAAASVPANPMTSQYDMIVGGVGPAYPFTRLPGPIYAATLFLQATGNGSACTGVQWGSLYPENISASGTGLAINKGGTGATTAQTARTNLLPSQTGNTNKALVTNGTDVSWSALPKISVRQTVLQGWVDANNIPNAVNTGSGLNAGITASAGTPLILSFAQGFDANGAAESIEAITANQSVPCIANQTNYLYADRVSPGTVNFAATVLQPQYGPSLVGMFKNKGSLMQFEGANNTQPTIVDVWGNTWSWTGTTANAYYSTGTPIRGTSSLVLNPAGAEGGYISSTDLNLNDGLPFTVEAEVTLLDTTNMGTHGYYLFASIGGNGFGLYASSAANPLWTLEINDGALGSVSSAAGTVTVGTPQHVCIEYDGSANYYLYKDGVQIATLAKGDIATAHTGFRIGQYSTGSTYWGHFRVDNFRVTKGYRRYGGAFTPPSAALVGDDVHWFDLTTMKMKLGKPDGTGQSVVERVFIGEAVAGASSISSVVTYAYRGFSEFDLGASMSGLVGGVSTLKNHNLGTREYLVMGYYQCLIPELNYAVGDRVQFFEWFYSTTEYHGNIQHEDHNRLRFTHGTAGSVAVRNKTTGAVGNGTAANWKLHFKVWRTF